MRSIAFFLCMAALGSATAADIRIVDDQNHTVTLKRAPLRIVSLLPSLTETVCELGACERLVGVDTYSNWPASVQAVPHVGGLEDVNPERIVRLKPDLVLLATSARIAGRLQALGIPVAALEPRSQADMQAVFLRVARLLALPDADAAAAALWQRMEAGVAQAAQSLPPSARGASIYVEVNAAPYAASESSFIGQVLARLGARNVVPGSLGPFPQLNPEFVVRADPQFIMVSSRDGAALATRPGWARISAIRSGQVCQFDEAQGDVLVRAGPRMAEAARLMAACLSRAPAAGAGAPR